MSLISQRIDRSWAGIEVSRDALGGFTRVFRRQTTSEVSARTDSLVATAKVAESVSARTRRYPRLAMPNPVVHARAIRRARGKFGQIRDTSSHPVTNGPAKDRIPHTSIFMVFSGTERNHSGSPQSEIAPASAQPQFRARSRPTQRVRRWSPFLELWARAGIDFRRTGQSPPGSGLGQCDIRHGGQARASERASRPVPTHGMSMPGCARKAGENVPSNHRRHSRRKSGRSRQSPKLGEPLSRGLTIA
jgi:hypothetical protein